MNLVNSDVAAPHVHFLLSDILWLSVAKITYLDCWCHSSPMWIHLFKEYRVLFKNILSWSDLASYNLVSASQISFAIFFSKILDNIESTIARCKLAIILPSISFHLSSKIPMVFSSIASKQFSFLKIALIFSFHREKLLSRNFLI